MKREGFWYSTHEPDLPMPIHSDTPFPDKEIVLQQLTVAEIRARELVCRGLSICRCCGIFNGSATYYLGEWQWPEGFRHYVNIHNVAPSAEFLEFLKSLED